jgi:hypothetical protein
MWRLDPQRYMSLEVLQIRVGLVLFFGAYWITGDPRLPQCWLSQQAPNEALRLAGIMCDPEERESIQRIMLNKKGARAQSDHVINDSKFIFASPPIYHCSPFKYLDAVTFVLELNSTNC